MRTTASETIACPPDRQCQQCKMVCQSQYNAQQYALQIAAQIGPQLRKALQEKPEMGLLSPELLDTLSRLEAAILSAGVKPSPEAIQRAKDITGMCLNHGLARQGLFDGDGVPPLPNCTLAEMLAANHFMTGYTEKTEKGTRHFVHVADRGIALYYAFEHYGRSPHALLEALGYEISNDEE